VTAYSLHPGIINTELGRYMMDHIQAEADAQGWLAQQLNKAFGIFWCVRACVCERACTHVHVCSCLDLTQWSGSPTLSLSLSLSFPPSPSFSLPLSRARALSLSLSFSLALSLSLSLALALALALSLHLACALQVLVSMRETVRVWVKLCALTLHSRHSISELTLLSCRRLLSSNRQAQAARAP
jgi:hypothetical protein